MSKNLLGGDNKRYAFSNEFKVKGKNLGTYDSKVISSISSSGISLLPSVMSVMV